MLLLPLPSLEGSRRLRFLGGLGLAPKDVKPIVAAMSADGLREAEREGWGEGDGDGILESGGWRLGEGERDRFAS